MYSQCVFVALVCSMQRACIKLSSVDCPALQYFPNYLTNDLIFETKYVIKHKMCVFIFSTTQTFLILGGTEIWLKLHSGLRVKVPIILGRDSNDTLIFLDRFSKKYSNTKFRENPLSGSRVVPCGRTEGQSGQTDMTKLIFASRSFEKAPKQHSRFSIGGCVVSEPI
jgi:hypothetical protein